MLASQPRSLRASQEGCRLHFVLLPVSIHFQAQDEGNEHTSRNSAASHKHGSNRGLHLGCNRLITGNNFFGHGLVAGHELTGDLVGVSLEDFATFGSGLGGCCWGYCAACDNRVSSASQDTYDFARET